VAPQAVDVEAVQGATEWVPASQLSSQSSAGPSVPSILAGFSGAAWLTIAAIGPGPLSTAQQQPAYVAQALGVLALIIAVHEAGHFAAARLQGIHVTKFAIGFGPALVKFVRGEVEYSLRAIPLGGYVAFPDENDPKNPYKADDPNLLQNRSILSRAAVISAGVIANVIFAYLTLLVQISLIGKAETSFLPGVKIPSLAPTSLAAQSGLQGGDIIMRVGDTDIGSDVGEVNHVVDLIRASPSRPIVFTVERSAPSLVGSDEVPSTSAAARLALEASSSGSGSGLGSGLSESRLISVTPEIGPDGAGRIGVRLNSNAVIKHVRAKDFGEVVSIANTEFIRLSSTVLGGLKSIVTNFLGVAGQLSGPVAIVAAGSEIAKTDSAGLFQFCAIVNINLAVVNTLPLPALDGGYLVLLAVEAVRGGKKLPEKFEQGVTASGALLLLAMGMTLVVKDSIGLLK